MAGRKLLVPLTSKVAPLATVTLEEEIMPAADQRQGAAWRSSSHR
jgi:hypothetical protein